MTVALADAGVRLTLPTEWRGFAKMLYVLREDYELELRHLDRIVKPGAVFVDVGASYGAFSVVADRLVGAAGQVIAFEPAPSSFGYLTSNVMRHAPRVVCRQLAVGDRPGSVVFYVDADSSRSGLRPYDSADTPISVTMTTLDDALSELGARRVDVIKIDVEGAEALVLRGALATIKRDRPAVIFEVNEPALERFSEAEAPQDMLTRIGYELFKLDERGNLEKCRLHPGEFRNVVALHPNIQQPHGRR